jgi:hypothetical protein
MPEFILVCSGNFPLSAFYFSLFLSLFLLHVLHGCHSDNLYQSHNTKVFWGFHSIQEITRHESSCYLSSCSIRFHSQCRGCLGILVVDIWVSFLLLDYIVDALNICVEGLWQWFSVNGYANTSTAVAPDSLL